MLAAIFAAIAPFEVVLGGKNHQALRVKIIIAGC